jgi:DNA-binding MarR family transcriptional regulator
MNAMDKRKNGNSGFSEELFVTLQRAAVTLLDEFAALVRPLGLTPAQYNVLRILRGGHQQPISCSDIAGQMITRDSDITRLVDRLEKQGLAKRVRECPDRRVVYVRITEKGLEMLKQLDRRVEELHTQQFDHLNAQETQHLSALLRKSVHAG